MNSAQALKDAVNSRTSYVRLIANIELNNSTLTVSSGTITLDLNGKTLSATRTSNGAATCISVNGGNLTITGGGIISATAKGTTGGSLGSWKNGYDGIALSYGILGDGKTAVIEMPLLKLRQRKEQELFQDQMVQLIQLILMGRLLKC